MWTNINVQILTAEAAITKKREHIYHAALLDPLTGANLTIDEIYKMVKRKLDSLDLKLIKDDFINQLTAFIYQYSSGSKVSKPYEYLNEYTEEKEYFDIHYLQNIRDLHFKLYYMDGTQVGTTFENYGLDYLERDCKQTNLTFLIDQVDRHFS